MIPYKSKAGSRTKISAYEVGSDYIMIQFKNKVVHKYSYELTGKSAVEIMKKYAKYQSGLSSYIKVYSPVFEELTEQSK